MSIPDERIKLILRQDAPYRWSLISPKGKVMLDDLLFASAYQAELWVKAYVSSWPNWNYELQRKVL